MTARFRLLALVALSGVSICLHAEPLTLDAALAAARNHPVREIAVAELELVRAEREQIKAGLDWSVGVEANLRSGRRPDGDWKPDNLARVVARKPLLDFGRTANSLGAIGQELAARAAKLTDAESAVKLDVMTRFFDVLLADLQFVADNEAMAVAFVNADQAQDRFDIGQLGRPELLAAEMRYQDIRERRNASEQAQRSRRAALAGAMNTSTLPTELVAPVRAPDPAPLPELEDLLAQIEAANPTLSALRAQATASAARLDALAGERLPRLEAEFTGGQFSRESIQRDELSAGLVVSVPLYQGRRVDARLARERAVGQRTRAEYEAARIALQQTVLDTVQEIRWLRETAIPAADKAMESRDWTLERARAEYELELRTNLGTAMADTQYALLRRRAAEYRLALAVARLEALAGGHLPGVSASSRHPALHDGLTDQ